MSVYKRIGVKPRSPEWTHREHSQAINYLLDRVDYAHITADSITDNIGVQTPVGTVADTRIPLDGNEWNMPENNSTPGIDVDFDFTDVYRIRGIVFNARYVGSASHYISFRFYDFANATYRNLMEFSLTNSDNYRTILLPEGVTAANFISSTQGARCNFLHPTNGNTSHDLFVDYIALLQ